MNGRESSVTKPFLHKYPAVLLVLMLLPTQLVQAEALPLDTTVLQMVEIPNSYQFDGTVEAVYQATVSAQTSGRITEVNFDVDDYVDKGDILVRFRDTEQRSRLKGAQANQGEAEARVKEAESEFARVNDLFGNKLVSKAQLDRASANRKASQERLSAAQAQVKQAEEEYEHTLVRAPFSGIVTKRLIEKGEVASRGKALMAGFSLERLRVTTNVPQWLIADVRKGSAVKVLLPGDERVSADVSEVRVFPYADPDSHTFKVRLELSNKTKGVYPGMFTKVTFLTGSKKQLLVPGESVVRRSEVTAVYVVKGQVVSMRQVRLGKTLADGSYVILAGLDEGEQVAVDPIKAGVYLKELRRGE